jgi:hypothetical protein
MLKYTKLHIFCIELTLRYAILYVLLRYSKLYLLHKAPVEVYQDICPLHNIKLILRHVKLSQ